MTRRLFGSIHRRSRAWGRAASILGGVAAVAACLAVFAAWRDPHLAVEVSNFIRSCF